MGIEGEEKKEGSPANREKAEGASCCDAIGSWSVALGSVWGRDSLLSQHTQEKAGGSSSRGNFSERVKLLGLNTELR
jgi:hypothetical protein